MTAAAVKCPLCGAGESALPLVAMPPMPRTGRLLAPDDSPDTLRPLDFSYCGHCGFIWLEQGGESCPDYAQVSRATERQLPGYIDELLRAARTFCASTSPSIVDIGCNDGAVLNSAAALGYERRLGVEPSQCLAEACARAGHTTECSLFSLATAPAIAARHGQTDVLFVRHVLEHVPDPADFLAGLHLLLKPDGVLLMEVPDTDNVLVQMLGHELWDEHLGYYTSNTIRLSLERAGFRVLRLERQPHRSGFNLVCWAKPAAQGSATPQPDEAERQRDLALCKAFGPRWRAFCRALRAQASAWTSPVAALGASHPQLNFFWYTGLESQVDVLADDDEVKIGRSLQFARPTPIISTAELFSRPAPKLFLSTAFGCPGWTSMAVSAMCERGVTVLDPYSLMPGSGEGDWR